MTKQNKKHYINQLNILIDEYISNDQFNSRPCIILRQLHAAILKDDTMPASKRKMQPRAK